MKKSKFILLFVAVFLVLLIFTKPSEQRCKNKYLGYAKDLASYESFEELTKSQKNLNTQQSIELHEVSEKYIEPELYVKVHDYFLFTTIKYSGLHIERTLGVGILNTIINL